VQPANLAEFEIYDLAVIGVEGSRPELLHEARHAGSLALRDYIPSPLDVERSRARAGFAADYEPIKPRGIVAFE